MIESKWKEYLKSHFKHMSEKSFNEVADDLLGTATFYYKSKTISLKEFPISHEVYSKHLEGATSIYVEAGTLSIGYDLLAEKYKSSGRLFDEYMLNDMANKLLEALMDTKKPDVECNFRFGIGYKKTPLSDLKPIIHLLNMDSVIFFTETGFMKPMKTIVGFRGIF